MTTPPRVTHDPGLDPPPLAAVFAQFDVSARLTGRDITQLFKDSTVSLLGVNDSLQNKCAGAEVALASSEEHIRSLERALDTRRRIQLLAGGLSILGTLLVGFGVNYL